MNEHTKTPRTDDKELESKKCDSLLHAHYGWKFARRLELELAAVTAERDLASSQLLAVSSALAGDDKGETKDSARWTPALDCARNVIAERDRLRESLRIIAGERQCVDNTMSNVDVARSTLAQEFNP